ncbi:MAG: GTP cyclohydrolase FolE2 [Pseudomonadota bacterium]
MNVVLPDVSTTESAPHYKPLDWVGMQGIDLPVKVEEPGCNRELHAQADLQVDLPIPYAKGIHMSRLYRLLDSGLGNGETLSPSSIHSLLDGMISTHEDCGSVSARIKMKFDLLLRRSALITEGLAGWKSYPVEMYATLIHGEFKIMLEVKVEYSSTCPCSAALSRQLIENGFREAFEENTSIPINEVSAWLRDNATLATPHSQRSEARVCFVIDNKDLESLNLVSLIDCVETAVATPVQTAVKRVDEQAFAALNGQNLMFVEDAARRIEAALTGYNKAQVYVRHIESLHPHDAVAWSSAADDDSQT